MFREVIKCDSQHLTLWKFFKLMDSYWLWVIYIDVIVGLPASMSIQEKIPVKNIVEGFASLAVVAASRQALHLCWAVV